MACLYPKYLRNKKGDYITVSCRKCHNCRIQRQNDLEFASMCAMQQGYKLGSGASFLTITYNDEHVPLKMYDGQVYATLRRKDFTKFWSDFRKYFRDNGLYVPQMVTCGEYGEKFSRCHYHSLIFGASAELTEKVAKQCWQNGIVHCGVLRPGGVRYVIDYIMKENDEIYQEKYISKGLERPFLCHSNKLGLEWFWTDFEYFPDDFTYIRNGKRTIIPACYRKRLPNGSSFKYENIKDQIEAYEQGVPYDIYCLSKSIDNCAVDVIKRRQKGKPAVDCTPQIKNYVFNAEYLAKKEKSEKEQIRALFRENGLPDWRDFYTKEKLDTLDPVTRKQIIPLIVKLDPYPPKVFQKGVDN